MGTGLVTMGLPMPIQPAVAAQLTEATYLLLPHDLGVGMLEDHSHHTPHGLGRPVGFAPVDQAPGVLAELDPLAPAVTALSRVMARTIWSRAVRTEPGSRMCRWWP